MKPDRPIDGVRFRGFKLTDGQKDLEVSGSRAFMAGLVQITAGLATCWFILSMFPDRPSGVPVPITSYRFEEYGPQLIKAFVSAAICVKGGDLIKTAFRSVNVGSESYFLNPAQRFQKFLYNASSWVLVTFGVLNLMTAFMDKFSPELHNGLDEIHSYASMHQQFYDVMFSIPNVIDFTKFHAIELSICLAVLYITKKADEISN